MTFNVAARLTLAGAVLLVPVAAGCSTAERGIAESPTSPGSSSIAAQATSPLPTGQLSSSLHPCDLLSEEDLAQRGNFKSEYEEGAGARSCHWTSEMDEAGNIFGFAVSVRDTQSIETLRDKGAGIQRAEVNQRPAAVSKNAEYGNCTVAMKLDDVSRVDVSVPRTQKDDACELGKIIAGMVEPYLPDVP